MQKTYFADSRVGEEEDKRFYEAGAEEIPEKNERVWIIPKGESKGEREVDQKVGRQIQMHGLWKEADYREGLESQEVRAN